MTLDTLFSPATIAKALAALTVAGFVLRLIGAAFGPVVRRHFPRAYPVLADVGRALLAVVVDLVGALGHVTAAGVPSADRITQPDPLRPVRPASDRPQSTDGH